MTILLLRGSCALAVALLALDRYSWGHESAPFGHLVADPVGGHVWQFAVVCFSAVTLAVAAVVAESHRGLLQRLLLAELTVFIAFNLALASRDGVARFSEWEYSSAGTGWILVLTGLIVRGGMLKLAWKPLHNPPPRVGLSV